MITFTILSIILLAIMFVAGINAVVCGSGLLVVFGDLIACGLIIYLLVRLFRRRK